MPEEASEESFNRISRAVQESILKNYPNPERRGCPGDEVLRRVAARTKLEPDEAWEHITHCSPCYFEFLSHKEALRQNRKQVVRLRRRTLIGAAVAVAIAPAVLITRSRNTIAEWDLEQYAPARSVGEGHQRPAFEAPLRKGRIQARLPLGTDQGTYQVEIRLTEEGAALQTATGIAQIVDGHTLLTFDIDLSTLTAGSYYAAIGGRGYSWRVQPLILK